MTLLLGQGKPDRTDVEKNRTPIHVMCRPENREEEKEIGKTQFLGSKCTHLGKGDHRDIRKVQGALK